MTAPAATTGRGRGTRALPWILVAVGLVLVALVAGSPRKESTRPYDPEGTDGSGTKALVTLLRDFGADVVESDRRPPPDADVALVLPSTVYDAEEEDALRRWAAEGHTLVVADPYSDLTPGYGQAANAFGLVGERRAPQRDCTIAALADVQVLYLGNGGGRRFPVPEASGRCFTGEDLALVVSQPEGAGQIVSVGSPDVLTNDLIDEDDNAVLATSLMAPRDGTRVVVLEESAGAESDGRRESLGSLLSIGVRQGVWQLALAFIVYAFVRGRRLGKPLREPQPVEIAGSELVSAVGQLLQQTRSPDRAAAVLRADLRRRLCERLGLPAGATPQLIATTAHERAGVDRDRVAYAVSDLPCPDEATLVALAQTIDDMREEVLHGRTP